MRLGALPRAAPLTDPNTPRKASWQPPSAAPAAALGPIGGDTPRRTASGAPSGPPSDSDIGIHTRVALTATPPVGATHPPSGGSSEAAPSSTRGASWAPSPALPKVVRQLTRRSTNAVQERYQNMAQERCNAAIERAAAIVRQRESNGLPPGVWWGFHYFWPPHAIEEKRGGAPGDPMEDPDFLKKVVKLMNDPTSALLLTARAPPSLPVLLPHCPCSSHTARAPPTLPVLLPHCPCSSLTARAPLSVVDTFCIFDADGSGSIDAKELEGLVQMLVPNPTPGLVKDMMRELDSNSDGEIDLWEFCVHMQVRRTHQTSLSPQPSPSPVALDPYPRPSPLTLTLALRP